MAEGFYLPNCRCGQVAIIRTSWTQANPGRRFLGCNRFENGAGCDFFQWLDRPMPYRVTNLLHNEEAVIRHSEEVKVKKLSWMQIFFVLVIGFVLGRLSVSA